MNFTPLKFQVPLAAGGIALMAFNYLQFAFPHGNGLITLADVTQADLGAGQLSLYVPLILLMLAFATINLVSTGIYLRQIIQWFAKRDEYREFIDGPPTRSIGIFVPIASLSMTANVVLAPLAFFIPLLYSNLQTMMLPGLLFFWVLWLMLFRFEFKVMKNWLSRPLDVGKLNFVWLVDVFAFGLVSLTGTGIAALADSSVLASLAAFSSLFTLTFGGFLLVSKLAYLIYLQIRANALPDKAILPAYFIVIPITCLFGFSFHRIALYMQTYFSFEMRMFSFLLISSSYVVTIGWGMFCLYLLGGYFKREFLRCDFSPTQWGIV
jgi:hypothetical protein